MEEATRKLASISVGQDSSSSTTLRTLTTQCNSESHSSIWSAGTKEISNASTIHSLRQSREASEGHNASPFISTIAVPTGSSLMHNLSAMESVQSFHSALSHQELDITRQQDPPLGLFKDFEKNNNVQETTQASGSQQELKPPVLDHELWRANMVESAMKHLQIPKEAATKWVSTLSPPVHGLGVSDHYPNQGVLKEPNFPPKTSQGLLVFFSTYIECNPGGIAKGMIDFFKLVANTFDEAYNRTTTKPAAIIVREPSIEDNTSSKVKFKKKRSPPRIYLKKRGPSTAVQRSYGPRIYLPTRPTMTTVLDPNLVVGGISTPTPKSTTLTKLTSPSTTNDSPEYNDNFDVSPFVGNSGGLGSALVGNPWVPLCPEDGIYGSQQQLGQSILVSNKEIEIAGISELPPSYSGASAIPSQQRSKQKQRKPLPPIIVEDPNDAVAMKRARNTLAARKYRQRKEQQKSQRLHSPLSLGRGPSIATPQLGGADSPSMSKGLAHRLAIPGAPPLEVLGCMSTSNALSPLSGPAKESINSILSPFGAIPPRPKTGSEKEPGFAKQRGNYHEDRLITKNTELPSTKQLQQLWWRAISKLQQTEPGNTHEVLLAWNIALSYRISQRVSRASTFELPTDEEICLAAQDVFGFESGLFKANVLLSSSAKLNINQIQDVVKVMRKTLNFRIGAPAWTCVCKVIFYLNDNYERDNPNLERILAEMAYIATLMARYNVMESMYQQWPNMSLEKNYEDSLVELCMHVFRYLEAVMRLSYDTTTGTMLREHFTKIHEADEKCRGFSVAIIDDEGVRRTKRTIDDVSDEDSDSTIVEHSSKGASFDTQPSTKRLKIV